MSEELKKYYDEVYSRDKGKHFVKYRGGELLSASHKVVIDWLSENVKPSTSILDFGCGEADFLASLKGFSRRVGIDFSEIALSKASEKYSDIELICGPEKILDDFQSSMEIVTSFGTLEHLDNPKEIFYKFTKCLKQTGYLIVSCPSFLNVRGIIWMTLVKLFNVPMSLSDKHFLSIYDFKNYAKDSNVELIHYISVDHELAQGSSLRMDMQKRLTNALRDSNLDNTHVNNLLNWVENNLPYFATNEYSGAETIYIFRKN